MTRLTNDPARFADEMLDGFAAACSRWVRAVPGGVIRATVPDEPTVAVVVGGGSGHYPAFGGLVGQGLAHGAAMGGIFASPSGHQVYDVAVRAQMGRGILLAYGNYAGDVLNFDQAQARLRAEGFACETVVVTDDVSSAAPAETWRRRGVAGGLVVFRAAAGAAERGDDLAAVVGVAGRANERTRSIGVAFGGCTLPGAAGPLFTIPAGRMAVGMGIHGEPGLAELETPTADGLAELLVGRLLAEVPPGVAVVRGARVAVILNGLGAVKYEELFVVYAGIARRLAAAGIEVVEPEVGELVTSLDMAGVSLTFAWLDDELEELWRLPADAPAYRKGSAARDRWRQDVIPGARVSPAVAALSPVDPPVPAHAGSVAAARVMLDALRTARRAIDGAAAELGRLDAVAGDGDHGIGMQRGIAAAVDVLQAACERGLGAGSALAAAAEAWADRAGGTSGALWGVILRSVAARLPDDRAPSPQDLAAGIEAAVLEVRRTGGAEPGDKTMVDAMVPFARTLGDRLADGRSLADAWRLAAVDAGDAAATTADMVARVGRARPHAERSLGTRDPGAVSFALVVAAVGGALEALGD